MGSSRFLWLLSSSSRLLQHQPPPSSLLCLSRHRLQLSFLHHYRHHHFSPPRPLLPTAKSRKNSSSFLLKHFPQHFHTQTTTSNFSNTSLWPPPSHPWPELSALLDNLSTAGYFNLAHASDEYAAAATSEFPENFRGVLSACFAFACDRTDLLRLLSRKEIEMVVQNGKPFLFKDGEESARRLKMFLGNGESNVADADKAKMVDLMRFLLSYASNVVASIERSNLYNSEIVESSVRHLLGELAKLSDNPRLPNDSGYEQTRLPDGYGQMPRPFGQNVEIKRGDWICPRYAHTHVHKCVGHVYFKKNEESDQHSRQGLFRLFSKLQWCNFMNFARNVKCLECEEARPKRQMTGGEWECPQCDFFNYARNTVCLRCDCKRPSEILLGNSYSKPGVTYSYGISSNKSDFDSRLAANEEKAQRWFSKVSELESTSDMSNAIADEDFPEIMPLRRGVNRFVVSTRKTPLERRLADAQYRRNMDNDGISERNNFQTGEVNKTLAAKVSRSLNEILGRSSTNSGSNGYGINSEAENPVSTSASMQDGYPRGTNSGYVPFVPSPSEMFAKKPDNSKILESRNAVSNDHQSVVSNAVEKMGAVSGSKALNKSQKIQEHFMNLMDEKDSSDKELEQAEKTEGWFKKVVELRNVANPGSVISNEGFSNIMPMHRGENKFVVSGKNDHSLSSPTYMNRAAIEQARRHSEKLSEVSVTESMPMQPMLNQQTKSSSSKPSKENLNEIRRDASAYMAQTSGHPNQNSTNHQMSNNGNLNSGYFGNENREPVMDSTGSSTQPFGDRNVRNTQTGNSLEGSAVKEPDRLDMSEEAKAERWFRRVAQIKDISELSQIPDEDFPSIMPMRKGVNRFVVSKRKTPMERRLKSQQYRRNLPVANSDPRKNESENS